MRSFCLSVFLWGLFSIAACEDGTPSVPCVNVPPSGCPQYAGVDVCQDPSCDAVYACEAGRWKLDHRCPARTADGGDATAPKRDAGGSFDASDIDAPPGAFGGPGCVDLQLPDCSLGAALTCGSSDCCGCMDLFVCDSGGWQPWGQCADGGVAKR